MSWLSLNFIYNVTFNVEHPCNLCGEFRFGQIWDLKTSFCAPAHKFRSCQNCFCWKTL